MKRTHLTAVLMGLAAIVASSSTANARYYQTGVNVYPAVSTPMLPAVATPMSMRTMVPAMASQEMPHVGVNVYPNVPTPMPANPMSQYADGPNLYQYVGSNPLKYVDPSGLKIEHPDGLRDSPCKMTERQDKHSAGGAGGMDYAERITDMILAPCPGGLQRFYYLVVQKQMWGAEEGIGCWEIWTWCAKCQLEDGKCCPTMSGGLKGECTTRTVGKTWTNPDTGYRIREEGIFCGCWVAGDD